MFDAVRFLKENFHNSDGVIGLLHAYRLDAPPRETVRKWFLRGGIPSTWFALLLCVLELDNGAPVRLAKYLSLGGVNAEAVCETNGGRTPALLEDEP